MEAPERLVLYDGVCGLCKKSVRWLIRRDEREVFSFAPLQGETGEAMRAAFPTIPDDIDTVVFIEEGRAFLRSRAFIRLARHLRYPAKALSWFWIVPAPLSDLVYRLVARFRYRIWGKSDVCEIPAPEARQRFLP